MDDMSNTFKDKLASLTGKMTVAEVSQKTGVSPQTIYESLNKGQIPRAATLLKIADGFGVSLRWLVDESKPARPRLTDAAFVDTFSLVREVENRYYEATDQFMEVLGEALTIDWGKIAQRLKKLNSGQDLPEDLEKAMEAVCALNFLPEFTIDQFKNVMFPNMAAGRSRIFLGDELNAIFHTIAQTKAGAEAVMRINRTTMRLVDAKDGLAAIKERLAAYRAVADKGR